MNTILERLGEPSTYAGGAVIAAMAPDILASMATGAAQGGAWGAIAAGGLGLFSIFMRENGGR